MPTINTRIKKLEQTRKQHIKPRSPIFVNERDEGSFDVFNPEGTGRIKPMTAQQIETRPAGETYLFLMADGGIYLEEE